MFKYVENISFLACQLIWSVKSNFDICMAIDAILTRDSGFLPIQWVRSTKILLTKKKISLELFKMKRLTGQMDRFTGQHQNYRLWKWGSALSIRFSIEKWIKSTTKIQFLNAAPCGLIHDYKILIINYKLGFNRSGAFKWCRCDCWRRYYTKYEMISIEIKTDVNNTNLLYTFVYLIVKQIMCVSWLTGQNIRKKNF